MRPSRSSVRSSRVRGFAATIPLVLLTASSPFPGGCGSSVTRSSLAPGTPASGCGVVNGTVDPSCSDQMGEASTSCPASAPLGCETGQCCPVSFPVCCANAAWCGATASACQSEVDFPSGPPGQHGAGGGTASGAGTGAGSCPGASSIPAAGPGGQSCSGDEVQCGTRNDIPNEVCCCGRNSRGIAECTQSYTQDNGCGFCVFDPSATTCGTSDDGTPWTCPVGATCMPYSGYPAKTSDPFVCCP